MTCRRSPWYIDSLSSIALAVPLAVAIAVSSGVAHADYVANKFVEPGTGSVLEYNLFVPTGYDPAKKYPLMVVLHAASSNQIPPPRTLASDGKGWAPTFINTPHQSTDPSFFMIPISQTNASGWGEATQPVTSPQKFEGRLTVMVLQQEVLTKYSIDPARLYITGPSMGGRGTWDIIRRYPGVFAAAAPAAAPASPADAALYANENIWAICGEVDPIVQGTRDTILAIRKAGGHPIYTELAGRGHDSWRSAYPDPQFVSWMFAQRLGVPWWTVSEAPTGVQGAALTAGWPATVPPANLPTTFADAGANAIGGGSDGGARAPAPEGGTRGDASSPSGEAGETRVVPAEAGSTSPGSNGAGFGSASDGGPQATERPGAPSGSAGANGQVRVDGGPLGAGDERDGAEGAGCTSAPGLARTGAWKGELLLLASILLARRRKAGAR